MGRELAAALLTSVLVAGCGSVSASKTQDGSETQAGSSALESTDDLSVSDADLVRTDYLYVNPTADTYYFCLVRNDSQETVRINGSAQAQDADGNTLGVEGSIYALSPGETGIMPFDFGHVVGVDHVDVALVPMRATYLPVISDLDVQESVNDRNVTLVATNTATVSAEHVTAHALFFDEAGNVCDYASTPLADADGEIKPGSSVSVQLNTSHDFHHAECYLWGYSKGNVPDVQDRVSDDDFTFEQHLYERGGSDSFSFLVVTSNADIPVGIHINATAYDANGNAVGAATRTIRVLGPGEQAIATFHYDAVTGIDHVTYAMQYDLTPD